MGWIRKIRKKDEKDEKDEKNEKDKKDKKLIRKRIKEIIKYNENYK